MEKLISSIQEKSTEEIEDALAALAGNTTTEATLVWVKLLSEYANRVGANAADELEAALLQ